MDRYLYRDILNNRDYLEWRELIDQLNKEYHKRYIYKDDGHNKDDGLNKDNGLFCRRCDIGPLFNYRTLPPDPDSYDPSNYCIYNFVMFSPCFDPHWPCPPCEEFECNCYNYNYEQKHDPEPVSEFLPENY